MIDRILVTGFAPWDTHRVNSSAVAIEPLDGIEIGGIRLKTAVLPVDFDACVAALLDAAAAFEPDAVISFGMLSTGPDVWRVELLAHNVDGRVSAASGASPVPRGSGRRDGNRALDNALPRILPTGLPAARIFGRLLEAGSPWSSPRTRAASSATIFSSSPCAPRNPGGFRRSPASSTSPRRFSRTGRIPP